MQTILICHLFVIQLNLERKGMIWNDKRVKLIYTALLLRPSNFN